MSAGVFTPNYRVTFVEKSASEVGDGTEYPLLVTLDQLAEIMYRVKDAWFTQGEVTYDDGSPPLEPITIINPPSVGDPRVFSEESSGDITINARGYFAEDSAIAAAYDGYFQDPYTPTYSAPDVRDIHNNERGMWLFDDMVPAGTTGLEGMLSYDSVEWGNAFAHYIYNYANPETIDGYGFSDGTSLHNPVLILSCPREVAWVGGVLPFDSTAQLYLKLNFAVFSNGYNTIRSYNPTGGPSAGGSLILQLSVDTLTIPLYEELNAVTGSVTQDFIIAAQEWWPYAKDSPPTPVWDSTTGIRL